MKAIPTADAEFSRTVTHHYKQKSNKEVVPYDNLTNNWVGNLSQTEGGSNQSEKLRPPSLLDAMKYCSNLQIKIERRM